MTRNMVQPSTLPELVDAAAESPNATILAGGTDLMVGVNFGLIRPSTIIGLRRVSELAGWVETPDDIQIGAATTYRSVEKELGRFLPALCAASSTVGSPPIRAQGTLGGNLGTASPAGDSLPILLALEAEVHLVSSAGERAIPLSEFIIGPKRTALAPGELIKAIHVPRVRGPQCFLKVGKRSAMQIAIASVALVVDEDRRQIRCALGSVGPTPCRVPGAEEFISSRVDWAALTAHEADIEDFAQLAAQECAPITDVRASAAYRRHSIMVVARRALTRSLSQ